MKSRPSPRRGLIWTLLKWGILGGLATLAVGTAFLAILFWVYSSDADLPRIYTIKDYQPRQVTRVLAADGRPIGEIFVERRTYVPLDKISPLLVQAIVDAEDAGFHEHAGLDFKGMLRAFWVNVKSGERRQGGSTITQQVVKTFFLDPRKTIRRKMQEIILARRLENALTKEEILALYLNQIYFGHGRYGVEEAARFFFGKSAGDLNVGEAALLAGLPQAPELKSPLKHPEAAKARQTYVLEQMVARGHLASADAQTWIDQPITLVKNEDLTDIAPEFVEIVRKELQSRYGEESLATLGLTVKTTLDADLQIAARAALESGLAALDERHGYRGPTEKLSDAKVKAKKKTLTKELPRGGPRAGAIYDALVVSTADANQEMVVDLGGWQGVVVLRGEADERYNPKTSKTPNGKKPSDRFRKNDVVRVRLAPELGIPKTQAAGSDSASALALELGPQGALVAMDPATRHVLAMVGGYHYQPGQFNRALRAKRQPGSAFKPFVYAAAMDTGAFTPATVVNDAPEVYDLWKPKNYEAEQFRGPLRLRTALAHSINTVAIRVLADVGAPRVVALARAAGITEELPENLSLALGSGIVTPLELVNAYATFAALGTYAKPVFLVAIGEEPVPQEGPTQALRPEIAYLTTSLMQSVVDEGTAAAAKKLKRTLAGKTGTSNGGRDAWFVGYSPDLVCGVWVGFDDMQKLGSGEGGGKAALPIWIDTMREALRGRRARAFRQPPGIVVARIDKATGKLAATGQPETDTVDEFFLAGTVPVEVAPAPGELDPSLFMLDQVDTAGPAPRP